MKMYLLREDIRKVLIDYMYDRPYKEVANGIAMLMSLPEYQPPAETGPKLTAVPDEEKPNG